MTSTGVYNSIVCGTGSADGINTGITATSLGLNDLTGNWSGKTLPYHIVFAGGQGALFFKDPKNPLRSGTATATGGGAVVITPTTAYTNGVDCTDGFRVVGALAVVIPALA